MDSKTRHLLIAFDSNVLVDACVLLTSLFENSAAKYHVHMFVDKHTSIAQILPIISAHKQEYTQHILSLDRFKKWPAYHGNYVTYFRTVADTVLPKSITRVVYFDVDMLVLRDISYLWTCNLQGHALGAVPDLKPSKSHTDLLGIDNDSYFNAGLLVLDLKKIRSGALFTQVRKYLTQNTDKIKYVDQDGLNAVFENDYLRLDQGYNYQHYFSKWFKPLSKSEISIIHYTGTIKPKYYISPHPLQGFFTPYVEKAGFKQDTVTPSKFVKKTFIGLFMYLKRLGFEDQLMTLQRLFKP